MMHTNPARQISIVFGTLLTITLMLLSSCSPMIGAKQLQYNTKIPIPANLYVTNDQEYLQYQEKLTPQELSDCHALQPRIHDNIAEIRTLEQQLHNPRINLSYDPNLANIRLRHHLIFGVDPNSLPFSYTNPTLMGLFIQYAIEINQRLFPHTLPEFSLISNNDDARQQLANQNIDLILAPYPISCEIAQNYAITNPFYTSTLAVASFDNSPLDYQTHQRICLPDKPAIKQIVLTTLPNVQPVFAPTSTDCLVAIQQGKAMLTADNVEALVPTSPYSAIRILTGIAITYFSAFSSAANTRLIKIVNYELTKILQDPPAIHRLIHSLNTAGALPNTASLPECKYGFDKILANITDTQNLSLELSRIENNLRKNSSSYSPDRNFCYQNRNIN